MFNAGGCINDLHDVKLGITYTSEFAYLADGKNGLRVVQLTSPDTPGNDGFIPRPTPQLVATYKIPHGGHVLAVAKGLDRDRAVDESGNQIAVFGRVGARPLNQRRAAEDVPARRQAVERERRPVSTRCTTTAGGGQGKADGPSRESNAADAADAAGDGLRGRDKDDNN